MKPLRFLVGLLLLLAGMAGLISSVIAIFGVQDAASTLSTQTTDILSSTGDAVQFLKRGTTKIQTLLAETQERTQALDATLAGVAAKIKNNPSGKTLLDALDQSIARQLARAQSTVAALQATLEGFHGTLVLFHSLPGANKGDAAIGTKGDKQAAEDADLPKVLLEASDILDQLAQFLNEVLTNREVSRTSLARLIELVEQIQVRLADAATRVRDFQQRLGVTEARIAASQTALPVWIDKGSVFAVVLLVCFAFTQLGLMLQARRLLTGKPS
ncbi:MAG: hypothetical protein FJ271_20020 [Planctomycetes bacterium]|nr:hypothetical protein [Planctomycetota bacterium]